MKPPGHVHTYVRTTRLRGRDGRRNGGSHDRSLWICTGCPKDVWTARLDGPQRGIHPWYLMDREVEMLSFFVDGRKIPYTAHHMGINVRSVQNMVSNVKRKMGADTLAEAVEAYREYERQLVDQREAA